MTSLPFFTTTFTLHASPFTPLLRNALYCREIERRPELAPSRGETTQEASPMLNQLPEDLAQDLRSLARQLGAG